MAPLLTGEKLPDPDDSDERLLVAESLVGMREKFPEDAVQVHLHRGPSVQHLTAASGSFDLLVIGHRPISALDDLVRGSMVVVEHARGVEAGVHSSLRTAGHEEECRVTSDVWDMP